MDHHLYTELLADCICNSVRRRDAACALTDGNTGWNDVMAAILKVWRQITRSVCPAHTVASGSSWSIVHS